METYYVIAAAVYSGFRNAAAQFTDLLRADAEEACSVVAGLCGAQNKLLCCKCVDLYSS